MEKNKCEWNKRKTEIKEILMRRKKMSQSVVLSITKIVMQEGEGMGMRQFLSIVKLTSDFILTSNKIGRICEQLMIQMFTVGRKKLHQRLRIRPLSKLRPFSRLSPFQKPACI